MSKVGIFGDPHLGVRNVQIDIFENQKKIFNQIEQYTKVRKLDYLVCLGDWFDSRHSSNNMILQESFNIVKRLASVCKFIDLIGNHDLYFKNSREYYTPFIFESIDNVTVINEPTVIDGMGFVPWLIEDEKFDMDVDYLFGHFEFVGAKMNYSTVCKQGLDSSKVSKYKRVFSGHFHTPSNNGNVTYVGGLMATTFAEAGAIMGLHILDTETDSVEFIKFEDQPVYMNIPITIESFKKIEDLEIPNNARLKLRIMENIGQGNIDKLFKFLSERTKYPISHDILYQEEIKQKKEKIISLDVRKYAEEYIDLNIPESIRHLKKEIINEIEKDLKLKGL